MATETHKKFNDLTEKHYNRLREKYIKCVEESHNKKYARNHFRTTIFKKNDRLPEESLYFCLLSDNLWHNYNIYKEFAILKTFESLPEIKAKVKNELQDFMDRCLEEGNFPVPDNDLAWLEKEEHSMSKGVSELLEPLALKLATMLLLEEFPGSENSISNTKRSKAHNRKLKDSITITESQHILAIHIFLEGHKMRTQRDHGMADFTRFAHLISRESITVLDNSKKYKITKKLFNVKSSAPTLKDLEFILPFFERIHFDEAVDLIKREIRAKKEEF